MGSVLWNIAAFVVALGILVAVHEFGHFWVARRCGVRVERFSIGFGRALWRRLGKDGTEYVVAMIPLGGYVKMLDGRVDELKPGDEQYAFNHKPVWARMAIVAAGPFANFLFALFAFWLMFMIGVPAVKPVVGEVRPASIAAEARLEPGMEIVGVNGEDARDWESVTYALIEQIGEPKLTLSLQQKGTDYAVTRELNLEGWRFDPDQESPVTSLGIVPLGAQVLPEVATVVAQGAAERAGLRVGDQLLALDGQPVTEWQGFAEAVRKAPGHPLSLEVSRNGEPLSLTLVPDTRKVNGVDTGYVGIAPKVVPLPDEYRILLQYGPLQSLWHGLLKTWDLIGLTFNMLGKLIGGIVSLDNLSGPISIAKGAGSSADYG
ncbi:RIP metalloprotease RseP, partial [Aeromonas salmonicida]